jgi:tetratricopeptide (TPR) repeat protein
MVLDADGSEVDWIVGYRPPPEKFHEKIERILSGVDTFKSLSISNSKNPKDVATIFKLARKYADRGAYDKALEKFKEVIVLDPEGKLGTTDYSGEKVLYTQYAEFAIASAAISFEAMKQDPEPLRAFVKKYPTSAIVKVAYSRLSSNYYQDSAIPKEIATQFYEEYYRRFPLDPSVLSDWMDRILLDKDPVARGIELAENAIELAEPDPSLFLKLARLYKLTGDSGKAKEIINRLTYSYSFKLVNYANFCIQQKTDIDNAVAIAEQALRNAPENARITQIVADIYIKTGRSDKALAIYGPAFAMKLTDAVELNYYASLWNRQNQNLESALEAAKKANEQAPNSLFGLEVLASIYEKQKNYDEALKVAKKANERAPTLYHLGVLRSIYEKQENYDEAIKVVEKARELSLARVTSEAQKKEVEENYNKQIDQLKKMAQKKK